jgi:hypothetical protein
MLYRRTVLLVKSRHDNRWMLEKVRLQQMPDATAMEVSGSEVGVAREGWLWHSFPERRMEINEHNKTYETWPMRATRRELLKSQQKKINWSTAGNLGYTGHKNKEAYASNYFQDSTALVSDSQPLFPKT